MAPLFESKRINWIIDNSIGWPVFVHLVYCWPGPSAYRMFTRPRSHGALNSRFENDYGKTNQAIKLVTRIPKTKNAQRHLQWRLYGIVEDRRRGGEEVKKNSKEKKSYTFPHSLYLSMNFPSYWLPRLDLSSLCRNKTLQVLLIKRIQFLYTNRSFAAFFSLVMIFVCFY